MQEQNSEKIVSLSVRATKMTARVLKAVIGEYLNGKCLFGRKLCIALVRNILVFRISDNIAFFFFRSRLCLSMLKGRPCKMDRPFFQYPAL